MRAGPDWHHIETELRRIFRLPPALPLRLPDEVPPEDILDHIARALREEPLDWAAQGDVR